MLDVRRFVAYVTVAKDPATPTSSEPRREKTCIRGFGPASTQTGLYNHRRWLEASNFGFRKYKYCTIYEAKTKALISSAVTAQPICTLVLAYAKSRFYHDAAHYYLYKGKNRLA